MDDRNRGRRWPGVLITVLITAALCFGGFAAYVKITDKVLVDCARYEEVAEAYAKYSKFFDMQSLIEGQYLYDYDGEKMMDDGYHAMLKSLGDVYTRYMDAEEYATLERSINSRFTGIGITFTMTEEGELRIIDVVKDGPAEIAGIQAGDVIETINGEVYDDMSLAAAAIRGDAGTTVKLRIKRGAEELDFSIIRGVIDDVNVESASLTDEIGYIRIKSFGTETADLFDKALSELESEGKTGVVIDLRGNPGGLFDQGIRIADRLLPEMLVTYTEDKAGNRQEYKSDEACTDLDFVILVNGDTASTSEVLAAAVKDSGRGTILGEQTFGKGVVQMTHVYPDRTAVNVTAMQYFSPNGNEIHGKGVAPDVVMEARNLEEWNAQIQKAVEILQK
ncbi:MAG: S41 family peptidase [Firmicutes bacterium]|nr:S41 family peptidase [Bacillota bacterium]